MQKLNTEAVVRGTVTGRFSSSIPNFEELPRNAANNNLVTATCPVIPESGMEIIKSGPAK